MGTVFLYLDYSVPIEALRAEFTRLLELSELWDGRKNTVQITNSTDKAVEIRFLLSAENSSNAFDLRCYVRENLIKFIRENYPDSMPMNRVSIEKHIGMPPQNNFIR